jgi:hypothetical protein
VGKEKGTGEVMGMVVRRVEGRGVGKGKGMGA